MRREVRAATLAETVGLGRHGARATSSPIRSLYLCILACVYRMACVWCERDMYENRNRMTRKAKKRKKEMRARARVGVPCARAVAGSARGRARPSTYLSTAPRLLSAQLARLTTGLKSKPPTTLDYFRRALAAARPRLPPPPAAPRAHT